MVKKYINKWDMISVPKFPESIKCKLCKKDFIPNQCNCPFCGQETDISYIIRKQPRPVLIWIGQLNWIDSIAFGIPLSSVYTSSLFKVKIKIEDCNFFNIPQEKIRPSTAIINQATRFSGNIINIKKIFGKLTNLVIREEINNKMFEWFFREL